MKNKNASVVQKNNQYVFTLFLEDENKFITFTIPVKTLNSLELGTVL